MTNYTLRIKYPLPNEQIHIPHDSISITNEFCIAHGNECRRVSYLEPMYSQPTEKSIIKTDAVRVGNIVEHERWGIGIVRELIDNNRCNVEFYPREENLDDRCCVCISKGLKIISTGP